MSPLAVPRDTPIAIYGFGIEGQGTLTYLQEQGFSDVTVVDRRSDCVVPPGVPSILGPGAEVALVAFRVIFRAPGIWRFAPALVEAEKKGARITSQLEVFLQRAPCTVIGVTGTKGKSTTTSLMAHIFREAGLDVHLAGNIGTDMLHLLGEVTPASVVVLELSSFQLDAVGISPRIAVLLGIVPEHLDVHGSLEAYVAAKAEILRHQREDDILLCAPDNELAASLLSLSPARHRYSWCFQEGDCVLPEGTTAALHVVEDQILWRHGDREVLLLAAVDVPLLGRHMLANVLPAMLLPLLRGVDPEVVAEAVQSFSGVPHRMERVGRSLGMTFYNDSAATTPEAAMAGIDAHAPHDMVLILGGGQKGVSLEGLARKAAESPHVRHILLLGTDAAATLDVHLRDLHPVGQVHHVPRMEDCAAVLQRIASPGLHVVLSPGCTSFDLFADYKARGEAFRQLCASLAETSAETKK
jgi:UDP-N-acetylmuramoylalanine--D-glutamate ligase